MEFARQADAMDLHSTLPILQRQDPDSKNRSYVIGTYWDLYHRYLAKHSSSKTRHYYELIRENGKGCALFFDIDYDWMECEASLHVDLLAFEILFLNELNAYILQTIPHYIPEAPIILDATSAEKFSRHYIVNIKLLLFSSPTQCGFFVEQFWSWFLQRNRSHPTLLQLLRNLFAPLRKLFDENTLNETTVKQLFEIRYKHVNLPPQLSTCQTFEAALACLLGAETPWKFYDDSIYTKNRLFRYACCTKPESSNRALGLVLEGPGTTDIEPCDLLSYETWLTTLVQVRAHHENITKIWQKPVTSQKHPSRSVSSLSQSASTVVVPMHVDETKGLVSVASRMEKVLTEKYIRNGKLDSAFQSNEGNVVISSMKFNSKTSILQINTRNHACRLHGRHHHSNHILFHVHVDTGKVTQHCYNRTEQQQTRWLYFLEQSLSQLLLEKFPTAQRRAFVRG